MKKVLLVTLTLFFVSVALADDTMVSIPKSKLTEQQLKELEKPTTLQEETKSWVGVGKEVGEAVNTSLSAVTIQANNFAQTPVGKLTAVVVVWKLLGADVIRVFFGFLELILFSVIWIWSYRRSCVDRTVLESETVGPDKTKTRKYKVVPYARGAGEVSPRGAHMMMACLLVLMIALTLFTF